MATELWIRRNAGSRCVDVVLERREIGVARQGQKVGEQIAGAAQMLVAHDLLERARELGADPQMLLDRERQRDRPERLPIGLGLAHAAILAVAHQVRIGARLVDQGALGQHRAVALAHRLALGLEQQRLAEALGRDDQHLLGGRGIEEVGDLVVEMQELAAELVQVLRLDVLRIDHPRFHSKTPPVPSASPSSRPWPSVRPPSGRDAWEPFCASLSSREYALPTGPRPPLPIEGSVIGRRSPVVAIPREIRRPIRSRSLHPISHPCSTAASGLFASPRSRIRSIPAM